MTNTQLTFKKLAFVVAATFAMEAGSSALAAVHERDTPSVAQVATPAAAAKEDHVKGVASQEIAKRRLSLEKEAIVANDEIIQAISFLQKKDTPEAYKALEKADGQLGVILARDPNLKLAAIAVRTNIYDLDNSPDTIRKAVKEAKTELDHGQIQAARLTLSPLTSEMHIDTDYLPMGIYPDAIKRASKEIQASKLNDAETTLANALGSIVTVEDVIPLPPLKAEGDILEAEQLLNKDKVKNKDKVLSLLTRADNQLASADALGYGKNQDIHDEIASIKSKVNASMVKPDLFERLKMLFHRITHSKNA